MRVLAAFVGGWGHAEPLLPLARLASAYGHEVVFAGQSAIVARLAAHGYPTFVVGPDTLSTTRLPLAAVDRQAEQAVVRDHFVARYGDQRAHALGQLLASERFDVVVCDEVDVGAVVAAERRGLPCLTVNVIAAGRLAGPAVVGSAWDQLRRRHGLGPDPGGELLGGDVQIVPVPWSFREPSTTGRESLRPVRPPVLDVLSPSSPADRTMVYATLGTVFNVESGDLLHRLAGALSIAGDEALLTIGPGIDPSELADVGPFLRVTPFVDQHEVLGRCRAVLCHGGSGTLVAALSLGVPVVVLPMGADQPDNGDRCQSLGVGLVLDVHDAGAPTIAAALQEVTRDPRYVRAAMELAGEAASQPRLEHLTEVAGLFLER